MRSFLDSWYSPIIASASLERYEVPIQMILFKSRFALMSYCNGAPLTYFSRTEGFNFTLKYEEWLKVLEHHFFSYWVDAVINENPWVDLQYIVNWWLQQGTAIVFLLKKVTSE